MNAFILFVDDEEKILQSLERELDEWLEERSLVFRSANSVDEALSILAADFHACEAVVSDLKMPKRKGSELLLEISLRWPDIASILLTGFSDMDEIKDCIKAGIVSFMQKPWNRDLLKAELERVRSLTKLRREHDDYFARLERDFNWTRKLHHELLLNPAIPGRHGKLDIASRFAQGTLDCGGDLILPFEDASGDLVLCFGSLTVTGVEGTYHGARIRELVLLTGKAMTPESGPDKILDAVNASLCAEFPDLPENSLSMSIFKFEKDADYFSCAHAGGEHFALTESGRLAVHTLPSPVLGLKENLFYPAKKYAFRDATRLILFSRPLHGMAATESRLSEALTDFEAVPEGAEKHPAAPTQRTAQSILDQITGGMQLPFDSTIAVYRKR